MKKFPYPLKNVRITVYGRDFCKYCQRIKLFLEKVFPNDLSKKYKYFDVDKIISNKQAKDYNDFLIKLEPFIGNYNTIPIIFIYGEFIGGFEQFTKIITNIAKNRLQSKKIKNNLHMLKSQQNISIEKRTEQILNLLKEST